MWETNFPDRFAARIFRPDDQNSYWSQAAIQINLNEQVLITNTNPKDAYPMYKLLQPSPVSSPGNSILLVIAFISVKSGNIDIAVLSWTSAFQKVNSKATWLRPI